MPRILEQGLNRLFRSRWGVALVILVVVLAVVGIGRVFAGENNSGSPVVTAPSPAAPVTVNPTDDDGELGTEPPPSPVTSKGRAEPEEVAYAFASAWVDHRNVSAKTWHDRLVPNATERLSNELNGVDPAGVPASRVLGRPGLVPVSNTIVNAVVNVDSGKLTLRLVSPDGHWLVDGVDWDRS
jgi:hypothetical protein